MCARKFRWAMGRRELSCSSEFEKRKAAARAGVEDGIKKARLFGELFDVIPAATYSPTQLPMQYHQLRRA